MQSIVMHEPIYPKGDDAVVYYIDNLPETTYRVELFILVQELTDNGLLTDVRTKYLLKSWEQEEIGTLNKLNHPENYNYGENKFITYFFEVTEKDTIAGTEHSYLHRVSFVTQNYVFANRFFLRDNHPIPVYVTTDFTKAKNIVFILDSNVNRINAEQYYTMIKKHIFHTLLKDEWLKQFRFSFNFFINPLNLRGTVQNALGDYNYHILPVNESHLTFAHKIILHKHNDNDREVYNITYEHDNVSGVRIDSYGTMLHEIGHLLFSLADEYALNGRHATVNPFPNVWEDEDTAKSIAINNYRRPDATRIDIHLRYWKICKDNCLMNSDNENNSFEAVCKDSILFNLKVRSKYSFSNNDLNTPYESAYTYPFDRNYINGLSDFLSGFPYRPTSMLENPNERNSHIRFVVRFINYIYELVEDSFEVLHGIIPYNVFTSDFFYSPDNFLILDKEGKLLYVYYRANFSNKNTYSDKDNNNMVEILVPYNSNIYMVENRVMPKDADKNNKIVISNINENKQFNDLFAKNKNT